MSTTGAKGDAPEFGESIWRAFGVDDAKEADGVWVDVREGGVVACRVKLKSAYSPAFRQTGAELREAAEKSGGDVDWAHALAHHLLCGWEGVNFPGTDDPIPFTADAAEVIFRNLPRLTERVLLAAIDRQNFARDDWTEVCEALGKSSSGTQSGARKSRRTKSGQ